MREYGNTHVIVRNTRPVWPVLNPCRFWKTAATDLGAVSIVSWQEIHHTLDHAVGNTPREPNPYLWVASGILQVELNRHNILTLKLSTTGSVSNRPIKALKNWTSYVRGYSRIGLVQEIQISLFKLMFASSTLARNLASPVSFLNFLAIRVKIIVDRVSFNTNGSTQR